MKHSVSFFKASSIPLTDPLNRSHLANKPILETQMKQVLTAILASTILATTAFAADAPKAPEVAKEAKQAQKGDKTDKNKAKQAKEADTKSEVKAGK